MFFTLQKLKFAQKLVKNVEFDNMDQSPYVLFWRAPGHSLLIHYLILENG
jgi:hypothetical protein